jgi:tetraacyldisaccharide 4'-kinase
MNWALGVLSGEDRSVGAIALRGALALAEPAYAQLMNARNFAYGRGILKVHTLPRPVISVGNLTTGGTGKTPMVRWLAEQLMARRQRAAVLLRGYRARDGASDEQQLLIDALGSGASVIANPDRVAAAMSAMRAMEQPDVFVLDDGFQHRRVAREFDLVLIDATQPFGFEHVLPRGLLREPLCGLQRADAVVVTRSDQATSQQLQSIEATLRRYVPPADIFFARHTLTALRDCNGAEVALQELQARRFFAFAGIANPSALRRQLEALGRCVGFEALADHHLYRGDELSAIGRSAAAAGAEILVTTEKDWVKLRSLSNARSGLPIFRLQMRIEFRDSDGARLLDHILSRLRPQEGLKALSPASSRRG